MSPPRYNTSSCQATKVVISGKFSVCLSTLEGVDFLTKSASECRILHLKIQNIFGGNTPGPPPREVIQTLGPPAGLRNPATPLIGRRLKVTWRCRYSSSAECSRRRVRQPRQPDYLPLNSGVVVTGDGRPERHLSKGRHSGVSTKFGLSFSVQKRYKKVKKNYSRLFFLVCHS